MISKIIIKHCFRIFVACEYKLYVFDFKTYENIDIIESYVSPKGVFAISFETHSPILAYPDKEKGMVGIKIYTDEKPKVARITAHESDIACMTISRDGSILATASDKGTLIRLFRISEGVLIQEVRRGSDKAEILCISFNDDCSLLACSSDRGTIHIFKLNENKEKFVGAKGIIDANGGLNNEKEEEIYTDTHDKKNKTLGEKIGKLFKFDYLNSEWSFAKFRINEERSICCFGPNQSIIVIGASGKYYQASFEGLTEGECTKLQENKFEIE